MKRVAGVVGIALTSGWGLLFACVGSDPDPVVPSGSAVPLEAGTSSTANDSGSAANDSGSAPAAGNVLKRSGFEDLNCLGWTSNQATLEQDPVAQSGKSSCRVCATDATSVWGIYQNTASVPKGAYTVTAYAHVSGDAGVPQHVTIRAVSLDDAGEQTDNLQERTVDIAVNDPTWQKASFDFGVENEGEAVTFGALINDTLEGCFLLDDFTVTPKK